MSWLFKACRTEDTTTQPSGEVLCSTDPCGPAKFDAGAELLRETKPSHQPHHTLATFFQPPHVQRVAASVTRRATDRAGSESARTASTAAHTEYDRSSQTSPIVNASDPSARTHAYQEDHLVVLGRSSGDFGGADLDWQERASRRNRDCCDTAGLDCLDTPIEDEPPIKILPY
jgi:hypothetical protein